MLIDDLVWPTTEVTRAVGAVAKGDLGQAMALEVDGRQLEGEFLRSATLVNKMIEQLSVFTFGGDPRGARRSARRASWEARLRSKESRRLEGLTEISESDGRQPHGTGPNIADVTIAVASGDLSEKITVDVRGEILQLKRGHQHDGRSAALVRVGGDARGARSGTEASSAARPWCPAWPAPGRT
jgi:hypothetical protein